MRESERDRGGMLLFGYIVSYYCQIHYVTEKVEYCVTMLQVDCKMLIAMTVIVYGW